MSVLARSISQRQWQVAALCLLLGFMAMVSKLPADSVVGLIEVIDGTEDGKKKG